MSSGYLCAADHKGEPSENDLNFGRQRRIVRVLVVLTLVLWLALFPGPALGGHADDNGDLADRDNNYQGVNGRDLTQAGAVACNWGSNQLDETVITVVQPDPSDIHCEDGDYSWDYFGLSSCEDVFDGSSCADYKLQFNLKYYGQIDTDFERNRYQFVGCQEFGHTSSLGHRPAGAVSCMEEDGDGRRIFDDHDHYAINNDI